MQNTAIYGSITLLVYLISRLIKKSYWKLIVFRLDNRPNGLMVFRSPNTYPGSLLKLAPKHADSFFVRCKANPNRLL